MRDDDLLTVTEAAALVRLPYSTVLSWVKTGRLKAWKIGGRWRTRRSDVLAMMPPELLDDLTTT